MVTTSALPADQGYRAVPDGQAMGHPYFTCSADIFSKCSKGGKKGKKWWKTYLQGDSNLAGKIREWDKKNKGKKFLLKDEKSDSYIFARGF